MLKFKIYKQDKLWIVESRNGSKCERAERTSKQKAINAMIYRTPGDNVYEVTVSPKDN